MGLLPFTAGLEIEFSIPDSYYRNVEGTEFLRGAHYSGRTRVIPGCSRTWSLKTDATCGYELVSPVLRTTEELESDVKAVCTYLKNIRLAATDRCGLHVHLGLPASEQSLTQIVNTWNRYEEAVFLLVPNHRKSGYHWCKKLHDLRGDILTGKGLHAWGSVHENRYHWLNLVSVYEHGTVEWRCMESSFDPSFILGWISFLSHMNKFILSKKKSYRGNSRSSSEVQLHNMLVQSGCYGAKLQKMDEDDRRRAIDARNFVANRYTYLTGKNLRKVIKELTPSKTRSGTRDSDPDMNPYGGS